MIFALLTALAGPTLALEGGVMSGQLQDLHQSPLPYGALGLHAALEARTRTGRFEPFLRLQSRFGLADARSPRPFLPAGWLDLGARGGVRALLVETETTTFAVGASLGARMEMAPNLALHVWGLGTAPLSLELATTQEVRGVRLGLEATLPLVAVVTRHTWSLDPVDPERGDVGAFYAQGSRVEALGGFLDARLRGSASFPSGRHLWVISGQAGYFGDGEPGRLRRLDLSLATGPVFSLGGPR